MRVRVVGAVNAGFNVYFAIFLLNADPALFVQGVGISKHCVTVKRLKFYFSLRLCLSLVPKKI